MSCKPPIVIKHGSTQDGKTLLQWYNWLFEMKKDEGKRMDVEHQMFDTRTHTDTERTFDVSMGKSRHCQRTGLARLASSVTIMRQI